MEKHFIKFQPEDLSSAVKLRMTVLDGLESWNIYFIKTGGKLTTGLYFTWIKKQNILRYLNNFIGSFYFIFFSIFNWKFTLNLYNALNIQWLHLTQPKENGVLSIEFQL